MKKSLALALLVTGAILQSPLAAQQAKIPASPMSPSQPFVRDPKIPIDEEYTTEPFFGSPLVDYLPASKTVPTPKTVLGDVAGAPGRLPYAAEVYTYMRMLEKAAPGRVKVVSIKHPAMGGRLDDVRMTLRRPDEVRRSAHDADVLLFHRNVAPRWVCAVVKRDAGLVT